MAGGIPRELAFLGGEVWRIADHEPARAAGGILDVAGDDGADERIARHVAGTPGGLVEIPLDEQAASGRAERQQGDTDHAAPGAEVGHELDGAASACKLHEVNRIGIEAIPVLGLLQQQRDLGRRSQERGGDCVYSSHANAESSRTPPSEYQRSFQSSDWI